MNATIRITLLIGIITGALGYIGTKIVSPFTMTLLAPVIEGLKMIHNLQYIIGEEGVTAIFNGMIIMWSFAYAVALYYIIKFIVGFMSK